MTKIRTEFGFRSTADQVIAGIDMSGKRVIVTGAASGIGIPTARALAGAGAELTLAVRNVEAAKPVLSEIIAATGNRQVSVELLDLADLASVSAFVDRWRGPLHVLVNNAGVMALPEQRTSQGWEMQFAINHLGHFALASGLRPALARAGGARVVAVSSSAHQLSPVVFDDIHFAFRPYEPILAYGQSKTANILFAVDATRRWADDGITSNALTPGAILTNLQRHRGGMSTPLDLRKTVDEGAATSVFLATSPLLEAIGGRYFVDCNEADLVEQRTGNTTGVAAYALDPANAERLWDLSARLIGNSGGG
jgi:NAD(P)-dependent dehydrogenase (short-subunit alcohol dehydrogenase family)